MTIGTLEYFSDRIDFPEEYRNVIFPLIGRIEAQYYDDYKKIDADRCAEDGYISLAEKMGEPLDTVMLAVCVMCAVDSKKRYDSLGISGEIYYASQKDITIWAKRCCLERGHIGVYAYEWLNNFTDPHVFRLGRLQFERKKFPMGFTYTGHGITLNGGDEVINIHIPEDGPLVHEDVLESYRLAYRFFGLDGKRAFVTHTWLIYPKNREFLPEKSNIRDFMDDYEILFYDERAYSSNLWRVFGRRDSYEPATLPRENSLQRNMADYLASHDCISGEGYGLFVFDGEEIVKE